jgi:hypothetical protein
VARQDREELEQNGIMPGDVKEDDRKAQAEGKKG